MSQQQVRLAELSARAGHPSASHTLELALAFYEAMLDAEDAGHRVVVQLDGGKVAGLEPVGRVPVDRRPQRPPGRGARR